MTTPKITRPKFPKGYVDNPISELSWAFVEKRLIESKNYWLCSTRPNGRPHVVPRWCVYLDGRIYYDGSPETRHARNIMENPYVSLHLESGDEVIILDGRSEPAGKPEADFAQDLSKIYKKKYAESGYAPEPNQWDNGGLYVFTPRQCLAWTVFFENPTKFIFE
jgi:pyridoxamine 5'-phosphate oxidase-like protein